MDMSASINEMKPTGNIHALKLYFSPLLPSDFNRKKGPTKAMKNSEFDTLLKAVKILVLSMV